MRIGERVEKGQLIASPGPHRRPYLREQGAVYFTSQAGQVVVFDTNYIPGKDYFRIRPDTFYIKRLVGLPGETISIRDRHLVVDGTPVEEPYAFKRQVEDPAYRGTCRVPGRACTARPRKSAWAHGNSCRSATTPPPASTADISVPSRKRRWSARRSLYTGPSVAAGGFPFNS
jgi:hypothetical protein